jgi:hydrogenase maturation protease
VSALVVGYGSDLRGDDAVGRRVAAAIEDRALDGVAVRSLHQLTPELAADLGEFDTVVFVDADVGATAVEVRELTAAPTVAVTTHHVNPQALLELAALLGDLPQRTYVVSVPAGDMEIGVHLSPLAAACVTDAVELVTGLCHGQGRDHRFASRGRLG